MANILIWPDINFEPGHWRPVMAMANKLKNNHTIKFLCTPDCASIIDGYEFDYVNIFEEYYPLGYSTLIFEKPEEMRSRIDHCVKIADGYLDDIITDFRPDLLLAGYFVSLEAQLIKYRYNLQYMITTTYLRHPENSPAAMSLRFLAANPPEISTRLMKKATGLGYAGTFNEMQVFTQPINDVNELITCPREFDFSEFIHLPNTHYVEPSILVDDGSVTSPGSSWKVIYTSAGSRVRDYLESARNMFKILEQTISLGGMENRFLRMAVGHTLEEDFSNKPRIQIVNWAYQTGELKIASSAVVHGGLASIKECIFFGVPTVIIPLGKDQIENANRVLTKRIGAIAILENLDENRMARAIMEAETNQVIRGNLQRMKDVFVKIEEDAPSLEIIDNYLNA
ncbi:MAG TPA: glycosyltransferase [Chitinispirillaceae bacterium]|nr:glycosyltransferase [Chitinispirillaceae bacterium]